MIDLSCSCGARFKSIISEAKHRHNFPLLCKKAKPVWLTPDKYAETPTEHAQQTALFMWAALPETLKLYPSLKYMFAIPNGGLRMPAIANRLKAEGVKSGVPDVFLPVPLTIEHRGTHGMVSWTNCTGLFIEMKRPGTMDQREGIVSDAQYNFMDFLARVGYVTAVCYTFEDARNTIIAYLTKTIEVTAPGP
jgi:hypothetical protein